MPSFSDVASQLGLPGGVRRLPCLTPDWETSLSSQGKKVPINPHGPKVPEEMIERVIRYSKMSKNCNHERQKQ